MSTISVPPAEMRAGGSLFVSATARNRGTARSRQASVRFFLSKDRVLGRGDKPLKPGLKVPILAPRQRVRLESELTIPAGTPAGTYRLIALVDSGNTNRELRENNNRRVSKTAGRLRRPTSESLIDRALAAGKIDSETAILYKVFSAFEDGRLPRAYRGDDQDMVDSHALIEAMAAYPTLSAGARAILDPFFIPPNEEGSWYQPTSAGQAGAAAVPGFSSIYAAGGKVKIWWENAFPAEEARAAALKSVIDDTVWPGLTRLMRAPLSDRGSVEPKRGGDDALDIILIPRTMDFAQCVPRDGAVGSSSAYVEIPVNYPIGDKLKGVAVHELMHACQFAYPLKSGYPDYLWFMEAVASWSVSYVYPSLAYGVRHKFFLDNRPMFPLDSDDQMKRYEAYAFPLFLAGEGGVAAGQIATMWNLFGGLDALTAIDAVIHGGFAEQFPAFARAYWNYAPYNDLERYGGITGGMMHFMSGQGGAVHLELAGAQSRKYKLFQMIGPLEASYAYFDVMDPDVKRVIFRSPLAGVEGGKIQAMWMDWDGVWHLEDWTNENEKVLCLDRPGQRMAKLALVATNSNFAAGSPVFTLGEESLEISKQPCRWPSRFVGNVTGAFSHSPGDTCDQHAESFSTSVAFELKSEEDWGSFITAHYEAAPDTLIDWSVSGKQYCCTLSIPAGRYPVYFAAIDITIYTDDGTIVYVGGGTFLPDDAASGTLACIDGSYSHLFWPQNVWFAASDHDVFRQEPQQPLQFLSGTAVIPDPGGIDTATYTWHLTAQ